MFVCHDPLSCTTLAFLGDDWQAAQRRTPPIKTFLRQWWLAVCLLVSEQRTQGGLQLSVDGANQADCVMVCAAGSGAASSLAGVWGGSEPGSGSGSGSGSSSGSSSTGLASRRTCLKNSSSVMQKQVRSWRWMPKTIAEAAPHSPGFFMGMRIST